MTELAEAPRLTAYCAQCLASTRRESAHSSSRLGLLEERSPHHSGGKSHGASLCVVSAPVIRRISASHKLAEALEASASARSGYPMKGRAWQTALPYQFFCIPSIKQRSERSDDGFGRYLLRSIHDKFESDTNRTVRSRECFLPYLDLINRCLHASRHHKPVDAASSELGGACGFVSGCGL